YNERTGRVRAVRDDKASARMQLEHSVEGGHRLDLGRGEAEDLSDLAHPLPRNPPHLGLHEIEERNERRPPGRILGRDSLGQGAAFLREDRSVHVRPHRSASPITGSRLATEAMTSATRPPRIIAGTA